MQHSVPHVQVASDDAATIVLRLPAASLAATAK